MVVYERDWNSKTYFYFLSKDRCRIEINLDTSLLRFFARPERQIFVTLYAILDPLGAILEVVE